MLTPLVTVVENFPFSTNMARERSYRKGRRKTWKIKVVNYFLQITITVLDMAPIADISTSVFGVLELSNIIFLTREFQGASRKLSD